MALGKFAVSMIFRGHVAAVARFGIYWIRSRLDRSFKIESQTQRKV